MNERPQGDPRSLNEQMVQRLLGSEPADIAPGGYGLRVLEVPGRTSGESRRTPIGLLERAGRYHLVCPDRTRDWAANLAAAGRARILAGSRHDDYRAAELHGAAAAEVVAAYLAVVTVPWATAAFGLPDRPTPGQAEPELGRMAVFVLDPA